MREPSVNYGRGCHLAVSVTYEMFVYHPHVVLKMLHAFIIGFAPCDINSPAVGVLSLCPSRRSTSLFLFIWHLGRVDVFQSSPSAERLNILIAPHHYFPQQLHHVESTFKAGSIACSIAKVRFLLVRCKQAQVVEKETCMHTYSSGLIYELHIPSLRSNVWWKNL